MAPKNEVEKTVKVDGVSYKLSELSDNAKKQMINVRITDQEIARLNQQLAIAKTARAAYARALADELPAKPKQEKAK
jgi:hypothetical protein